MSIPRSVSAPSGPEQTRQSKDELEALEVDLLLEAVYRRYGYDFREYARSSLKRRIYHVMAKLNVPTISRLQDLVLHNSACMQQFVLEVSVNVTAMYRDPSFFLAFRRRVVPVLRTYPFIRVWHAGCSTGEEVYSMAILLLEEGLYDRCRIYATDMDELVLRRAREGIIPLDQALKYSSNYFKSGGKASLEDYYTIGYGNAIFRSSLRENILFSQHNLAMDGSFNEFNVILCRNVMIYFSKPLQHRVHDLLYESLAHFGILGLGSKESLHLTPHEHDYAQMEPGIKLYRRIQ